MESKLAASLAHEINNPLDSVLSLLYLVESEGKLTEKGHEYLSRAAEEVQRVAQIARAALLRSRDYAVQEEVDVTGLVDSVIDLYRRRFESRGIAVSTRYCVDRKCLVYSGPLRQVFSNLLLNAADAMPRGGRLYVRARSCREWSGRQRSGLRVTIADSGSGIEKQNLRQIFEPFFTTKGSGGTGMGLYLVKEVVQRHGGALRVRSSTRSGRSGSVFTIFLPVDSGGKIGS
jgi:signal transduction histidine kinase